MIKLPSKITETALYNFLETWSSNYSKITNILSNITYLFTYKEFLKLIKISIYINNLIKCLNKYFKRRTCYKEPAFINWIIRYFLCTFASEYHDKILIKYIVNLIQHLSSCKICWVIENKKIFMQNYWHRQFVGMTSKT